MSSIIRCRSPLAKVQNWNRTLDVYCMLLLVVVRIALFYYITFNFYAPGLPVLLRGCGKWRAVRIFKNWNSKGRSGVYHKEHLKRRGKLKFMYSSLPLFIPFLQIVQQISLHYLTLNMQILDVEIVFQVFYCLTYLIICLFSISFWN